MTVEEEIRDILLTLWDNSVGTPEYHKELWRRLSYLLSLKGIFL